MSETVELCLSCGAERVWLHTDLCRSCIQKEAIARASLTTSRVREVFDATLERIACKMEKMKRRHIEKLAKKSGEVIEKIREV